MKRKEEEGGKTAKTENKRVPAFSFSFFTILFLKSENKKTKNELFFIF